MKVELIKETDTCGMTTHYAVIRMPGKLSEYHTLGVEISDEQAIELFDSAVKDFEAPKTEILKTIEI